MVNERCPKYDGKPCKEFFEYIKIEEYCPQESQGDYAFNGCKIWRTINKNRKFGQEHTRRILLADEINGVFKEKDG
jgi:hypothetical protein